MKTTTFPMTTFFTIDTLQFSKRLQKAGLAEKISDELAEAINETSSQALEGLATKQDVFDVKRELNEVRNEINSKLEMMKKDIIIKLGSIMVVGIGIVSVLSKLN